MSVKLAECVGLWLAEGDSKTKYEITFTNNNLELINHFHESMMELFRKYKKAPRIYIYSSNNEKINLPFKNCIVKNYIDKRARKTYFIWRLASVDLVKIWKRIVEESKKDEKMYSGILRGFFAGEGTVKEGSNCSRSISMSQNKKLDIIDKILNFYEIDYKFSDYHRQGYVIHMRSNLEKLDNIGVADLHSIKKEKFRNMLKKYKQTHYKRGYLRNKVREIFEDDKLFSTKQLSKMFNRSEARIRDILMDLKKENILINFKVGSETTYWVLNKNNVIISKRKYKYLKLLNKGLITTKEISIKMNVCYKASDKRIKELNRLGLVKRNKDKKWEVSNTNKEVIVM